MLLDGVGVEAWEGTKSRRHSSRAFPGLVSQATSLPRLHQRSIGCVRLRNKAPGTGHHHGLMA